MKNKRSYILAAVCIIFSMLLSFSAFAEGEHDTPVIPIHTRHSYSSKITKFASCTEAGEKTYTCRVCGNTYTEAINPLGHLFCYNGNQTWEGVELKCFYCDTTEVCTATALEEKWKTEYVNEVPYRTGSNDSGYLDLDGNRLINAKDYAMILKLETNEKKLVEKHNQTLLESQTEEELP